MSQCNNVRHNAININNLFEFDWPVLNNARKNNAMRAWCAPEEAAEGSASLPIHIDPCGFLLLYKE